jgi:DNA-binding NtrC family response regulator
VSDIPPLVDDFLNRLQVRLGRPLNAVSDAGMHRLMQYSWPGNVRELHNVLERAAVMSEGSDVEIPGELLCCEDRGTLIPEQRPNRTLSVPDSAEQAVPACRLEDVERGHILSVLERTRWRLSGPQGASAILGLHPNTLRHRMKKLGITR